jgi:hypothetical protein
MRIRDPVAGIEKIRIRDKHPGSVTCLVQYRNSEEPQILIFFALCGLLKKSQREFFLIFSGRCHSLFYVFFFVFVHWFEHEYRDPIILLGCRVLELGFLRLF